MLPHGESPSAAQVETEKAGEEEEKDEENAAGRWASKSNEASGQLDDGAIPGERQGARRTPPADASVRATLNINCVVVVGGGSWW